VTPRGELCLKSKSDFQRFCAELRTISPKLDDVVEALQALSVSELRPTERGRFAQSIARYLGASFPASEVRAVISMGWTPEIAMALRGQAPTQGEPPITLPDQLSELPLERPDGVDLLELSRERNSPLTVVLMGDEDEHRVSIDRLRAKGIHYLRENSLRALRDAFEREAVVGLVVGQSWWTAGSVQPRQRLLSILEISNLCWIKLARCTVWASVEDDLPELCTSVHLAHPLRSRLAVEDQATITNAELRCLTYAIQDLEYAERNFSYDFTISLAQDRILRGATSRYLRDKYPAVRTQEASFRVRTLAQRGENSLASLVTVVNTDVAFVIKVSPYRDALDEARRFRLFAHGTSFEMAFFCHGMQGALVFAPVDTRLGEARSLESTLSARDVVGHCSMHQGRIPAIDSAIAALQRFSGQVHSKEINTHCCVDSDSTEALVAKCGPLTVAGKAIDLKRLYACGLQALNRCSSKAVVQHGDAHPGNILFSSTNTAVLIDYECAGLGPACYDLSMLWIHVFASQFVAVGDEHSTVGLLRDVLEGVPFEVLERTWPNHLQFSVNQEVVYLVQKAIGASFVAMEKHSCIRKDVYGVVATILCGEFLNPRLQQFAIRCALAAVSSVLVQTPT